MSKHLMKRVGAVCTSAVMSLSALIATSTVTPITADAAGSDNYARLLQYSLYLYDANMCGDISGSCAMEWRGNCHMDDQVKGGYHDAGDHVMFGLPQGYAASTIAWSYYEFKNSYDKLGLTDHYKTINKHFIDFFKASTKLNGDSVSEFLYQKGEGQPDHNYWGAPENQTGSRKMYWTSNGASDIAAEYAAALALDYINFKNDESLKYAKALYNFSCQNNQVARDGVQGFYLSNDAKCSDDQAWAAAWLHIATGEGKYLDDAKSKVTQYLGWAHAWGNTDLGAATVIAEITKDWSKVNGYIGSVCNSSNYLCMDDWGSARYNCGMQFISLLATKKGGANYANWAQGQMNLILGGNGGKNYVVGWDNNSPTHCHHRAASGMNDSKSDEPNKYVLVGALVGGPNKNGLYVDQRYDEIGYMVNEVALDYQACLVCAAAALYDKFGTGSCDTSITGVKNVNLNPGSGDNPQQPQTTTAPPDNPQQPTVTDAPNPSQPGTASGNATVTAGDEEGKYQIAVNGPCTLEIKIKTNSNDWESNGGYGYSQGDWVQKEWKADSSSGSFTVSIDVPSGVSNVQFQIYWPKSATIESASYTGGSSNPVVTDPPQIVTQAPVTTTTTTTTITTTTSAPATTTTTVTTEQNKPKMLIRGDANCDGGCDVSDAVLICRLAVEDRNAHITDQGIANADANRDGKMDSDDVVEILNWIAYLVQW
jgi:hypothetical protein